MKTSLIKIASYDVLPNSTVRPSALLRYMQQLAREDCDGLGCTYRYMRSLNTVFVLTQLGMRLDTPVFEGETVKLTTFNDGVNGLFLERGFLLERDGKTVGICSSRWVLVRYDTRALVKPRDFPVSFECVPREREIISVPRRFDRTGAVEAGERVVRLSDLDENNHLNNCVYADVAMDALDGFDGIASRFSEIKINFLGEARRGDVLSLSRTGEGYSQTVFGDNATSGRPCFEAETVLEPFS